MAEAQPGWKKHFAKFLDISRTSLYVPAVAQDARDEADLSSLLGAHADHAGYGYRRLQLALQWSAHKTRRLMALAAIVPLGVKRKPPDGTNRAVQASEPAPAPEARTNLLKERQLTAAYAHHLWAEDFTYLWFQGKWHYLATVIDLYSRQIVGWDLSVHHDTDLVEAALLDALSHNEPPAILHQDQGSEYCSERYDIIALSVGIELSFSEKGSPWENGFQESFYRYFKLELGAKKLDRFADTGELHAAIASQLQYYNTERIHSALATSPAAYAAGLGPTKQSKGAQTRTRTTTRLKAMLYQIAIGVRDRVFGILGA